MIREFKKVDARFEAEWDEIRRTDGVPARATGALAAIKNFDDDPIGRTAIHLTDKQVDALASQVYKVWWRSFGEDIGTEDGGSTRLVDGTGRDLGS